MRDLAELVKDGRKIRLYPSIRTLTELKFRLATAQPRGRGKSTIFADNAERDRALERRVAELVADGWVDNRAGKTRARPHKAAATARPPAPSRSDKLEGAFAALVEKTLAALGRATTEAEDARAWRAAVAAYGRLKVRAGGDRTEHLVHFFAVDGIAIDRRHPVVLSRARATKARKARWLRLLESA
jgi:hypothetical protein